MSWQPNAVNTFLLLYVLRYLNLKFTWNQAVLTEDPFLIRSEVIRDCSCQDFLLAKRTWLFFPCSIAAKNSMGNFAAVQPAVILKQGQCCVLTILYFHLVSMSIHPMFSFWYLVLYAYTVYKYIYILYYIFFYIYVLLSWEWCDYVIIMRSYKLCWCWPFAVVFHIYNEKTIWLTWVCFVSIYTPWIGLLSTFTIYLTLRSDRLWLGLHTGCS